VGVLVPAPRRWAVIGIATVAGTAAALVTWGAAVEGRLRLAERDARGLGREGDAAAVALLERLGRVYARLARRRDAGLCFSRAVWEASRGDAPARFAASMAAADTARSSIPVPNCSARSGSSVRAYALVAQCSVPKRASPAG